ncbi:unnamed protein product [Amaranthus hypochondriacus]
MGAKSSKLPSNDANPPVNDENTNTQMNSNELSSYLQDCQLAQDVQVFDSSLHEPTTHIINFLTNAGDEFHSLSLDSL